MIFSSPCDQVAAALVQIQAELEDPTKSKKVDAGSRKYSYAELDKCLPDIRELCTSKGVAILQSSGAETITTTLLHTSGQWAQSSCPMVLPSKAGDPQAMGSCITYSRRYGLFLALGIAAQGEDNDGAVKQNRRQETPDAKAARQADHDPSWEAARPKFAADVKERTGHDLSVVTAFCEKKGAPTPSHRTNQKRAELLDWLCKKGKIELDAFAAEIHGGAA